LGAGLILVTVCLGCSILLFGGGLFFLELSRQTNAIPQSPPPVALEPYPPTATAGAVATEVTPPVVEVVPHDTLETLRDAVLPVRDVPALACRLHGACDFPRTVPSGPFAVGDARTFNASDIDENRNFEVNAHLQYLTDHAYFWVEDGAALDSGDLGRLAEAFESQIYPTTRDYFGSEWSPGVDEDPRIHILFARGLGAGVAGFFSSADEYPPMAHEFSNAHEIFFFNADYPQLRRSFTYGVLAHEFQHMIQWNQDRNEDVWLNEGLSELAAFLNGYDLGGYDYAFIVDPDRQLTTWPHDVGDDTIPHYGAGFLFTNYFMGRFGKGAIQALARHPANGLDAVDAVLRETNAIDPLTQQPISADDFFLDWAIANYLHDPSAGDGRYAYENYADAPQAFETETFNDCPTEGSLAREVHQYGTDYIRITCPGSYSVHFSGATELPLMSADPHSGRYSFWSNRGDQSATGLERQFDFTGLNAPIEMSYHTWYDIEDGYDFAYLEASTDGENWQILKTPSSTLEDPSGNSFGWGYTGSSGGWLEQRVDLSEFAGRTVRLRFEYVTDDGANADGLLLDDISIPAAGYSTDFEADDGGWQPAGFARVTNSLPQNFRLALITRGDGTNVQILPLSADQGAEIPLNIGEGGVREAILVVSGTTRFTTELANYSIEIR
jgi:hypothetical protein